MLWVKGFHVIAMVAWFSGIFYLPRLFVYHAESKDQISNERFKIMEQRLYYGIATPSAIITIILGIWMLYDYAWALYKSEMWLHLKLGLVIILVIYHFLCGHYLKQFKNDTNKKSSKFFRFFNEFPVLILIAVTLLVIVKPF